MGELSSTSHICFVVWFFFFITNFSLLSMFVIFFAVKCHMSFQFLYHFMGNGEILKSPTCNSRRMFLLNVHSNLDFSSKLLVKT